MMPHADTQTAQDARTHTERTQRQQPVTNGSWWASAPRENFTQRAEVDERPRMAKSETAKRVLGYTVGWSVSGRKP